MDENINNQLEEPLIDNIIGQQLRIRDLIFPFFQPDVQQGNYIKVKKALLFTILCLVILLSLFIWIFWVTVDALTRYKEDFYVTEAVFQLILYSTIIIRILWTICTYTYAYCKPAVLANQQWQSSKMRINRIFILVFNLTLINAFLVYLWNFITEAVRNGKK